MPSLMGIELEGDVVGVQTVAVLPDQNAERMRVDDAGERLGPVSAKWSGTDMGCASVGGAVNISR